ncbi:MAG: hypothetical protein A3J40_06005 [Erythrobacter sp. RIFCSPHIGHO2_12_FULL_63_10]|nr:MAG: hypothetical protein A3J40_06005 [Erythrobacter sp. RIFCSPHIGHO2_12_FULL_63_10]
MSLSLYQAFVPTCQQLLGALSGLIDKGEQFAREKGIPEAEMMEARLAEDMWSLPWHVRSCHVHSALAIELLPTGEISPDFTQLPQGWDAMRAQVAATQQSLAQVTEDALEALADHQAFFVLGGKRLLEFTGQNYLLSFAQPQFYFHVTTFYDILRMKGVPLGKRDFMGAVRIKMPG